MIASYAVLMASRENSLGIDGLQVAIVRENDQPFFLGAEDEEELRGRSEAIHANFQSELLKPFHYRPVGPDPFDGGLGQRSRTQRDCGTA